MEPNSTPKKKPVRPAERLDVPLTDSEFAEAKIRAQNDDRQFTLFGTIKATRERMNHLYRQTIVLQKELSKVKRQAFHDRPPVHRTPFVPIPATILFAEDLSPRDVQVYGAIQLHAINKNYAWPSQELLAGHCNCDTRTIQRSLTNLVHQGYILVGIRRTTNGCRHVNQYTLNLEDDTTRSTK